MKNEDINKSNNPHMRVYSIFKNSYFMIINDNNEHLTISKKNIPFSSRSLENLMLVLYTLNKRNNNVEIMAARTVIGPIEFII